MNKARRSKIDDIKSQLDTLKDQLETLKDEETEAFENRPDSFKESDAGQETESKLDSLTGAFDQLEEVISGLEDAIAED